jgi:phosphatidylinositol-3-phosphatase
MQKSVTVLVFALLACTMLQAQTRSNHVVVVVEENTSYSSVINNSHMPYLNSLARKYGLATNYYANTHPSIGNYFMMTTGQKVTDSDGYSSKVNVNNLARQMITAGKIWKSYAESLPSTGYTGGDKYPYIKHHNPFAYFTDVVNSSSEKLNLVPFTKFATDRKNQNLPHLSFIIPNQHHNMHDCPNSKTGCSSAEKAAAADLWLKQYVGPVLSSSEFQKDGVLIIVWDEGYASDGSHGGGHVATVVAGPKARQGVRSGTFYQHQSLNATLKMLLGLPMTTAGTKTSFVPMTSLLK